MGVIDEFMGVQAAAWAKSILNRLQAIELNLQEGVRKGVAIAGMSKI